MGAWTALLVRTATSYVLETRGHSNTCACDACEELFAIWLILPAEDQVAIKVMQQAYAGVRSDIPCLPATHDDIGSLTSEESLLLRTAISAVVSHADSGRQQSNLPDLPVQLVGLIMKEQVFAPLRQRIYRSLFGA